ncbi:hypothetical protein EYW49_20100 [Siculibacillus lacustris]|uniref:Uncharacterized protein n=1 Tax=Siculibacillus lacustris TaxID=1549641 RepID=A0A4Q9VH92_9HYPH|nr:hypothetical protein [Siculibacillus lacustris]TBW33586.1 hypothetical protein EYW49_20100 [Siculibacillus lacustris]
MGQFSMEKSLPPGSVLRGNQHYIDNEDSEQAIRATWTREKPQRTAARLTEAQVAEMLAAMKRRFDEIKAGANLLLAGE